MLPEGGFHPSSADYSKRATAPRKKTNGGNVPWASATAAAWSSEAGRQTSRRPRRAMQIEDGEAGL